jgi:uracil-DNA glycosylase
LFTSIDSTRILRSFPYRRVIYSSRSLFFSPRAATLMIDQFFKPLKTAANSASPAKKESAQSRKRNAEEAELIPTNANNTNATSPAKLIKAAIAAAADDSNNNDNKAEEGSVAANPVTISALNWVDHLEELLDPSWRRELAAEFKLPYWAQLKKSLKTDLSKAKPAAIFPPYLQIFRAFQLCEFESIKVVIIGQDPYHNTNQAEGLSFSVPPGQSVPSSLRNIYKELENDLGKSVFTRPKHGNLIEWAKQGVLLLNTTLTVRAHEANSHAKFGWTHFTDAVIKAVSRDSSGVVFLLWGNFAQGKAPLINLSKHHVLKAAHPSGLSADRGFFGCKHFSKVNDLLVKQGKTPINWSLQ